MSSPITPVSSSASLNPNYAIGQLLDEYTLENYVSTQRANKEDASQPLPPDQRKREIETAQPTGTATPQQRTYQTAQSTAPSSGNSPAGSIPQNLPLGLREQLVENTVRRYVTGQETDASSKLPDGLSQQQALLSLQALGVNPAALPQQLQATQSEAIKNRIATNRV